MNATRQQLLQSMLQNQQRNVNTPQPGLAAFLGSFAPAAGLSSMAAQEDEGKAAGRKALQDALMSGDRTALRNLMGNEYIGDQAGKLAAIDLDEKQFEKTMEFQREQKEADRSLRMQLARELAAARQAKADEPKPISPQAQRELIDISKKYSGDTVLEDALGRMEVAAGKQGSEKAYSGFGADVASVAAKVPVLSEFVDPKRLETTENLNKLADTLSLQYLESFGGSDTEREQMIARELSALGNMSPAQRKAAINTARQSLKARKEALQKRRDMIMTDPAYRGGNPTMLIQDPQLSLGVLDE